MIGAEQAGIRGGTLTMPKVGDHIVVVGGCDGIGLALAQSAHQRGSQVTVTGRGAERAASVAASIGAGVKGAALDLLDSASIGAAISGLEAIDHLVLTPVHPGNSSVRSGDAKDWTQAAHVKLVAYLEVIAAALPKLKPTSSIVLFGGVAKLRPYPGSLMVSIVNGGIDGMTRSLAIELAPIRVNGISPGVVGDSPRWERRAAASPQAAAVVESFRARTPGGRLVTMAEVIDAVFFLMDNGGVNGVDLQVDRGFQLV
jgi:NAD(P)-dependent dehydrogenase (short-subunit alcohol dehydrogenase family)